MSTTVQNPFQNVSSPTSTQQLQSFNPTAGMTPTTQTNAFTSTVDKPTETVQGQMDSILSKDSPLMQRARTLSSQQMNQRGLVNSSMAAGAGTAAMIDAATPIAQQDAQINSQRNMFNTDAQNQNAQFNTGQNNDLFKFGQDVAARFGLQQGQQSFEAGQNDLQRGFQENMAKLQESGMDFRQAREIASREMMTQLEMAGVNNRFDRELALKSEMFNTEQYNLERRQILDNQAQLERLGLQINANNQNIPTSFAASISNTAMTGVNAIMADANMTAASKQTAVNNLINYANAQISWAEKFYAVAIPRLGTATVA